jgi:DNA-directed RNA polymerase subunit RPC12/RpoP
MQETEKEKCLRCNGQLRSIGRENIQLGHIGWLSDIWDNILSGSLEVSIYICSNCGKVELYAEGPNLEEDTPQVICPKCGYRHDFDYPKCPSCGNPY